MSREKPGIDFANLSVSYAERCVLKDISGSLPPGTFAALIGPNGSGKSTLLKALGGLLPYAGSIALGGREVASMTRRELGREVGMLPQQVRLDTALTVYDLIALGRLPHEKFFEFFESAGEKSGKNEKNEKKIFAAAATMQLEDLLFKSASRISGGEAQRALIAMILAQDPQIFLLDEPNSATDIRYSITTLSLFKKMTEESGRLVVASIHDINLALRFADYVIALKGGTILWSGPSGEVGGELLESVYDVGFESFMSRNGKISWHAVGAR